MIRVEIMMLAVFALGLRSNAYEVYEKSLERLIPAKQCQPITDSPSDSVTYTPCASLDNKPIQASKGSLCRNYQTNSCGSAPSAPPAQTGRKQKPWNYFDPSNPEQVMEQPAMPASQNYNVQGSGKKKKKSDGSQNVN